MVALLAMVSLGPAIHEGVGHDTDCEPVFVVHDAGEHRIGAAPVRETLPGDEHCVACHLFRNTRTEPGSTSPDHDVAVAPATRLGPDPFTADGSLASVPARAPPARL